MKKIFILGLLSIYFVSCKSKVKMVLPTPSNIYIITDKEPNYIPANVQIMETPIVDKNYSNALIIYYDKTIETKKLPKTLKKYNGKIVYYYENFSAMAVSFPKEKSLNKIANSISKVKGVLAIQYNEVHQLRE